MLKELVSFPASENVYNTSTHDSENEAVEAEHEGKSEEEKRVDNGKAVVVRREVAPRRASSTVNVCRIYPLPASEISS